MKWMNEWRFQYQQFRSSWFSDRNAVFRCRVTSSQKASPPKTVTTTQQLPSLPESHRWSSRPCKLHLSAGLRSSWITSHNISWQASSHVSPMATRTCRAVSMQKFGQRGGTCGSSTSKFYPRRLSSYRIWPQLQCTKDTACGLLRWLPQRRSWGFNHRWIPQ